MSQAKKDDSIYALGTSPNTQLNGNYTTLISHIYFLLDRSRHIPRQQNEADKLYYKLIIHPEIIF